LHSTYKYRTKKYIKTVQTNNALSKLKELAVYRKGQISYHKKTQTTFLTIKNFQVFFSHRCTPIGNEKVFMVKKEV
jgi:hypothetical protein